MDAAVEARPPDGTSLAGISAEDASVESSVDVDDPTAGMPGADTPDGAVSFAAALTEDASGATVSDVRLPMDGRVAKDIPELDMSPEETGAADTSAVDPPLADPPPADPPLEHVSVEIGLVEVVTAGAAGGGIIWSTGPLEFNTSADGSVAAEVETTGSSSASSRWPARRAPA
jgi:hypothetical protein